MSSSLAPATRVLKRPGRPHGSDGRSAICTLSNGTIAHMPCNPAVGGTAKGHLVREIDALGGLMGRAIDATGIQFKLLNRSRGPAVWSPRAQADKRRYSAWVRSTLKPSLDIEWIFRQGGANPDAASDESAGSSSRRANAVGARSLVVTTGTFLNGLIHIGREQRPAGRAGEPPSHELAESLKSFGFEWGRLKTGHPAAARPQEHRLLPLRCRRRGDTPPVPFSFETESIDRPQIDCHVLYTTDRVHDLVREQHRQVSPVQRPNPRHRPALLPVARRQGHALSRTANATKSFSSPRVWTSTRFTSTASR